MENQLLILIDVQKNQYIIGIINSFDTINNFIINQPIY